MKRRRTFETPARAFPSAKRRVSVPLRFTIAVLALSGFGCAVAPVRSRPAAGPALDIQAGQNDKPSRADLTYIKRLRRQIRRQWAAFDLKDTDNKSCAVRFTLAKSGEVSDVQMIETSGDAHFDATARAAILAAAVSNPLPDTSPKPSQTFRLRFNFAR